MSAVTAPALTATLRRVLELATLAPSVHNTQPWWWRVRHNVLELHADPDRQLHVADPHGRNMVISCGAALHQAEVAAGALGLQTEVARLPEGAPPGPLARITVHRTRSTATDEDRIRLLEERRTDRRRFTSWPVAPTRLENLAGASAPYGVRAVPLYDVSARYRVGLLVSRAQAVQSRDPRVRAELDAWVDGPRTGQPDGEPLDVLPPERSSGDLPTRFPGGILDDGDRDLGGSDALMVLTTPHDDPGAWLAAGEAMAAVWLAAADSGLSVVPLSQPLEVPETRVALQLDVLETLAVPQLLLRIGWQPISRSTLPRSPRRPLDDVLRD
jgi:hypothetical protein